MNLNDDSFEDLYYEDRETIEKRVKEGKSHRGRKKRKKRPPIPVIMLVVFAFLLVIIITWASTALSSFEGFGSSTAEADRNKLFGIDSDDEAGIILNDEYMEEQAFVMNGEPFLSFSFVKNNLNDWFYYDENEKLLLYSTPEQTFEWGLDKGDVTEKDGEAYLSLELVKAYTDMESSGLLDDPAHIILKTEWGTETRAIIDKNCPVRLSDSKKSEIITNLSEGDDVKVLEANNVWSRVQTPDGFLGYVENKRLKDFSEEETESPGLVEELQYNSVHYDQKIIMGWHQMVYQGGNDGLSDFLVKDKTMNVISPTWYSLTDTEGGISDLSSSDYVQTAHEARVMVWPAVDNFNTAGFDATKGTFELLSHTSKRKKLIENIVLSILSVGADGINIDFENLSGETGEHFAQFLKELSIASKANGLVLSVDNYVPKEYSKHYHREVQGKVCDFVVIMGYDEHNAGSTKAGPVASIDFVREGIEETLREVDASKVINGLPFFSRLWQEKNGTVVESQALGMAEAKKALSDHGATASWDDASGCNYGEYESGGARYRIWLEDADSVNAKLNLMKVQGLAGAAFWKLGLEESGIWDLISTYALGE
ncbi:MAG: SH3 domain-containing protein [Lachnospiraceae bacterium]|nr:SH3 domain-containing protein [Lachnospiraceae bacterium]